jgi:hypothetical protein
MAFTAASITVLGKTPLADGTVRVRAKTTLDNAYPVTGYDFSPATILAALGLSGYAVNKPGNGWIDPIVTGVNQQGILAEFQGLKLLISFPTGGSATAPATMSAPKSNAGASTASAVDATQPNLIPGVGKACVVNTDFSGASVVIFFDAYGYPA